MDSKNSSLAHCQKSPGWSSRGSHEIRRRKSRPSGPHSPKTRDPRSKKECYKKGNGSQKAWNPWYYQDSKTTEKKSDHVFQLVCKTVWYCIKLWSSHTSMTKIDCKQPFEELEWWGNSSGMLPDGLPQSQSYVYKLETALWSNESGANIVFNTQEIC